MLHSLTCQHIIIPQRYVYKNLTFKLIVSKHRQLFLEYLTIRILWITGIISVMNLFIWWVFTGMITARIAPGIAPTITMEPSLTTVENKTGKNNTLHIKNGGTEYFDLNKGLISASTYSFIDICSYRERLLFVTFARQLRYSPHHSLPTNWRLYLDKSDQSIYSNSICSHYQ